MQSLSFNGGIMGPFVAVKFILGLSNFLLLAFQHLKTFLQLTYSFIYSLTQPTNTYILLL